MLSEGIPIAEAAEDGEAAELVVLPGDETDVAVDREVAVDAPHVGRLVIVAVILVAPRRELSVRAGAGVH